MGGFPDLKRLPCRFQGRSALKDTAPHMVDFLASALKANVGIEEQPSLIPDT